MLLCMDSERRRCARHFSDWLQEELDRRGWRQADLARATGASTGNVSTWINGQRLPDPGSVQRIARALGLRIELVQFHAGMIPQLPIPPQDYELERGLRRVEQELESMRRRVGKGSVSVRKFGRVPADTVRWVLTEGDYRMEPIPERWIGDRSPEEFFIITASGDCLMARGILDGFDVLLAEPRGRQPANGAVVWVRVGDEHGLKVWERDGDWITLRDGDGAAVRRISVLEEFEVLGIYVTSWNPENLPSTGERPR